MFWLLFVKLILFITSHHVTFEQNSEVLVVSDQPTDFITAKKICLSSGGSLAQIDSRGRKITTFLTRNLRSRALAKVQINEVLNRRNSFNYQIRNSFFYRARNSRKFNKPQPGRLQSFFLYRKATGQFNKRVSFCYADVRSAIRNDCPRSGWMQDFYLFGGTNATNDTITLYAYFNYNLHSHSTVLFLNDSVQIENITKPIRESMPKKIYIPDISIFIGAHSKVGQSNWFWNNGTMINNAIFPTSNKSVCQEMTWPLTYDNGIDLRPTKCESKMSLYVCKVKVNITVSPFLCNSSMLQVSWELFNFDRITQVSNTNIITIKSNRKIVFQVPYSQRSVILHGLKKQTKYKIEVSYNWNSVLGSSSASATTSVGIPNPIKNPQVITKNNTKSECVIEWQKNPKQFQEILYYKIFAFTTSKKVYNVSTSDLQTHGQSLRYNVDLSDYRENLGIVFKVQAFSCEGASDISLVSGFCFTPSSTPVNILGIVGLTIAGLLLFILIMVIIYIFNKRKQDSSPTVEYENIISEEGYISYKC